jgi:HSP20 family molecular chaperone IbpA
MSLLNNLIPARDRSAARNDASTDETVPAVKPRFEIKETPDAYNATVYLPGVAKDGLEITAEESQIRIFGRRAWQQPEGWTALYQESPDAGYELVLEHDNTVDAGKIVAELRHGVLQVSLPKHEAIKPRKIAVG